MQKLVAVTIPIYKQEVDYNEFVSLIQCLKVLYKYPIIFYAPQSLNTTFYEDFCKDKEDFRIERFDDSAEAVQKVNFENFSAIKMPF